MVISHEAALLAYQDREGQVSCLGMRQYLGYIGRHLTQGFGEGGADFLYILSAESIHQRSFLAATHGTRLALHRSVERRHNLLMFLFCHAKEFYQGDASRGAIEVPCSSCQFEFFGELPS